MGIKVLHIIKSLGRGGAEMLLPETLKLHDRNAFEFEYLYFLPWKDQMVKSIEAHGGKVMCFAANNNLQMLMKVPKIVRYVRDNKIQLIHSHLPWAGIVARIVGRITGVPVIYTEHNKQERYHKGTRAMNLATMNWQQLVVAVSNDVNESIRKHKPSLKARLITILNGVNVDHFRAGAFPNGNIRSSLNIPADAPVVGTVAVFRFQKRLDAWLSVAKEILARLPDAHFIIVGDGPLKQELLAKADALGIAARVHFTGLQTEVRPYLASMDVYMMSSVFEGLPIALLEAMAFGCPVVSTDAGGIREVIRDGIDGLTCHVDEPGQLTELAVRVLKDNALRGKLSAGARSRIEASFSMNTMISALETVYRNVLDTGKVKSSS